MERVNQDEGNYRSNYRMSDFEDKQGGRHQLYKHPKDVQDLSLGLPKDPFAAVAGVEYNRSAFLAEAYNKGMGNRYGIPVATPIEISRGNDRYGNLMETGTAQLPVRSNTRKATKSNCYLGGCTGSFGPSGYGAVQRKYGYGSYILKKEAK